MMGRTEERDEVLRRLRSDEGGVVLAGPRGAGKTRFALDCLAVAREEGFTTLRVAGSEAARHLPLGCFAPLMPDLGERPTASGEMLRRITRAIVDRGDGKGVLLFVDDAHLLDATSAALTYQLAVGRAAFVLAAVRSGAAAPGPVVAMWKDAGAVRLELEPLSEEQLGELLAQALGGPVTVATLRWLYERSGGDVGIVRELTLGSLERGALRRHELWHLSNEVDPSARLIELVEARLTGLTERARRGLELVAVAGSLAASLLEALAGAGVLDELERRELARAVEHVDHFDVVMVHPTYREVLQASLSPWRRQRLYRALTEGSDVEQLAGSAGCSDATREATWQLRSGGRPNPGTVYTAALQAWRRNDPRLAEELIRAAADMGVGMQAELLLAIVLSSTGRGVEAEARLSALAGTSMSEADWAAGQCTRIENLAMALGELSDAFSVADGAIGEVRDPVLRRDLRVRQALLLHLTGRAGEARAALEPLLDSVRGSDLAWACRIAGYAAAQRGDCRRTIEITDRGLAAHRDLSVPPPFTEGVHAAIRTLSLAWSGHLLEAEQWGLQRWQESITNEPISAQAAVALALCVTHLLQGRIGTAIRWGSEAATLSRAEQRPVQLRIALTRLAEALALGGKLDEADRALTEAAQLTSTSLSLGEADSARARAWVHAMRGHLSAAKAELVHALAAGCETENVVAVRFSLYDLVRFGDLDHVEPLRRLADSAEGPLMDGMWAHASGVAQADPDRMLSASKRFEAIGALLLAADAAANASVQFQRRSDGQAARTARRRANALRLRCEGGSTPTLAAALRTGGALAGRQLEIASLAAAGLSNKEIAIKLGLSVRTVENKLSGAYQKLGVSSRAALTELLAGL